MIEKSFPPIKWGEETKVDDEKRTYILILARADKLSGCLKMAVTACVRVFSRVISNPPLKGAVGNNTHLTLIACMAGTDYRVHGAVAVITQPLHRVFSGVIRIACDSQARGDQPLKERINGSPAIHLKRVISDLVCGILSPVWHPSSEHLPSHPPLAHPLITF